MIPTFEDFIDYFPKYKGLINNRDARLVYEFLARPESLALMIQMNDQDRPALSGCVVELEDKYGNLPDFILKGSNAGLNRQVVGSMVKVLLEPFGYGCPEQKRMPANLSELFTTAAHYEYRANEAKVKIVTQYDVVPFKLDDN